AEGGGGTLFDAGDAEARARAHAAVQRRRADRNAALSAAGAREVVVRTDGDYLPALRTAFGRSPGRR
ncbi:MAG: hypothetical protein U0994_06805, partial [Gemmatimonadales bacterium]|nr:hypothetical protein [Gemmatimonadales bacterium]